MKRKLIICTLFAIMLSAFILPTDVRAYNLCVHEWSDWEISIEPTCSWHGIRHRRCNKCHEYEYEDIPATGRHMWSNWEISSQPTCSHPGARMRRCSVCQEFQFESIPQNNLHEWSDWSTDRPASYNRNGVQSRYCEYCYVDQYRKLPKKKANAKQRKLIKAVGKYFSAAKKYNPSKLNSCFVKKSSGSFFSDKKYMIKYCRKYNKDNISYDIKKISIKGKTATVKVEAISTDAYDVFYASFSDTVDYSIAHPGISTAAFNNYFSKQLKRNTRLYDVSDITTVVNFSYKKVGGKWKISKNTLAIRDIANCRYEEAYKDYF